MEKKAPRKNRRAYIAEEFGADISEVDDYQKSHNRGFPVFQYGGDIMVVVFASDSTQKASAAFKDEVPYRKLMSHKCDGTIIFIEVEPGDVRAVDVAMVLCDRKKA